MVTIMEQQKQSSEQKKELKRAYKEIRPQSGVFQIRNLKNQKVWIKALPDLKSIVRFKMQLEAKMHYSKSLQAEWEQYGPDAFGFEILEVLDEKTIEALGLSLALKKLEAKWMEQLAPYGEKGYHQPKREKPL